jgi:hypothetical protein
MPTSLGENYLEGRSLIAGARRHSVAHHRFPDRSDGGKAAKTVSSMAYQAKARARDPLRSAWLSYAGCFLGLAVFLRSVPRGSLTISTSAVSVSPTDSVCSSYPLLSILSRQLAPQAQPSYELLSEIRVRGYSPVPPSRYRPDAREIWRRAWESNPVGCYPLAR